MLNITCPLVDEACLDRFRAPGECEYPPCRVWLKRRQPHHIFCRGLGGAWRLDHPWFLVSLCPPCHGDFQANRLERSKAVEIAAAREGVKPEEIEAEFYRLRRTPR